MNGTTIFNACFYSLILRVKEVESSLLGAVEETYLIKRYVEWN